MTITRNFKLCLNAGTQNAPYINVNQYDEGEQWVFDLYTEGGQKFTPSTGAIIGIKADGNAILNSGTVNASGQVVITETQQMTAASGLAVFELLIEGETHGTANFIVNVERRPSDDAEFSDSDLSMLQEAIDAAEVINEILDAGGDPSEIITENVDAWLDNHPEATTTVQDGAITAPKLNNSLWDKLLVNEEASGAVASFIDGADDVPVNSLKVALNPVQDFNGYDHPWVGGAGKNKYNSLGLVSYSNNGITVAESKGTLTFNGTATANAYFSLPNLALTQGNYVASINNASANGNVHVSFQQTDNTYFGDNALNTENKVVYITNRTIGSVLFYVTSGTTLTNFTVKPQLEMGTVATAYQPYENICPIIAANGKNMFDPSTILSGYYADKDTDTLSGSTTNYRTAELALYQGTYTISFSNTVNIVRYREKGITSSSNVATGVKSYTFTVSTDATVALGFRMPDVAWDDSTTIQIERGSVATPYLAYQSIMVERCGINQWDEEYRFGYYDASGVFHARTSQGEIASKNMIPVLPNTTYYFHIGSNVNRYVCFYDANGNIISQSGLGNSDTAFTTPNNCQFINFNAGANYGTTYNNDISINYPSTITDYHAYIGTSYPYSLGQSVYGGTVDLATGTLTVTHVMWTDSGTGWIMNDNGSFYKSYSPSPTSVQTAEGCACNYAPYAISYGGMAVFARPNGLMSLGDGWGSVYPDVASLQAAFASTPIQVVYKLATPQTIQLTPQEVKTLLGYNNISSTGTVDVIYHADTKLYIDKRIAELG